MMYVYIIYMVSFCLACCCRKRLCKNDTESLTPPPPPPPLLLAPSVRLSLSDYFLVLSFFSRGGPVDMFALFKEVQRMGGHEAVTRDKGWVALATSMGFLTKNLGLQDAYLRYLADFEV